MTQIERENPWSNTYINTEYDARVTDKVGSLEGTARELAKHVDETVNFVVIEDPFGSHSRHVQISLSDDLDRAPDALVETLESWGYERSGPCGGPRGVDNYVK